MKINNLAVYRYTNTYSKMCQKNLFYIGEKGVLQKKLITILEAINKDINDYTYAGAVNTPNRLLVFDFLVYKVYRCWHRFKDILEATAAYNLYNSVISDETPTFDDLPLLTMCAKSIIKEYEKYKEVKKS